MEQDREMSEGLQISDGWLDALMDRQAPDASAWFTRVHRELARSRPGEAVFRLGEDLDDLVDWMEAEGIIPEEGSLLSEIRFDTDWNAARLTPEGGWCVFRWRDLRFRVISVRAP